MKILAPLLVVAALGCSGRHPSARNQVGGGIEIGGGAIGGPALAAAIGAPGRTAVTPYIFDLNINSNGSGTDRLTSSITINGVTVAPTLDYRGEEATSTTWPAHNGNGDTLTLTGAGSSPTIGNATPFTSSTSKAVTYIGGKTHIGSSTTTGDIGTDDFVIEFIVAGAGNTAIGKYNSGGCPIHPQVGWQVIPNSMSTQICGSDGTTDFAFAIAATLPGALVHGIAICDRDQATAANSCRTYSSGTAAATYDIHASSAAIATTSKLVIKGANRTSVALLRMWHLASWFAGGAQNVTDFDNFARDEANLLHGLAPGTAAGAARQTTQTRGSAAYVDVANTSTGVRSLFLVTSNWPRLARRYAATAATYSIGYLAERLRTNKLLQSQVFGTTWTMPTAGDTQTADQQVAPDLTTTGDDFTSGVDAVGVEHCFQQAPTLTATGYTFSVFAKAGARSKVFLRDATIANGVVWFDLSTCAACTSNEDCPGAVGTKQAGVTSAWAQNYGAGWCRVSSQFTGTAAAHTLNICGASADNTLTYTSPGGVVDYSAWQADAQDVTTPLSPILTTTGTAQQFGDDLRYVNTTNINATAGTLIVDVLSPVGASPAQSLLQVSSSAASGMDLSLDSSGHAVWHGVNTTGGSLWNITGTTDVTNGEPHTIRATYDANSFHLYVDGVEEGTPVTSGAVPAFGTTQLHIGQDFNAGTQVDALILRVRAVDRPSPPTPGNP